MPTLSSYSVGQLRWRRLLFHPLSSCSMTLPCCGLILQVGLLTCCFKHVGSNPECVGGGALCWMTSSGCMIHFSAVIGKEEYCDITATSISFQSTTWNQFVRATYSFTHRKCLLQLLSRWQSNQRSYHSIVVTLA